MLKSKLSSFIANLGKENPGMICKCEKKLVKDEKKRLEEEGIVVKKGKPGRKRKQANYSTVPAIPKGEAEETIEEHRPKTG